MEANEKERFLSIVHRLEGLRVDDCRMAHEIIKREKGSIMPLPPASGSDAAHYRGSLCDPKSRDHLGCAHTMCRARARELIAKLARDFPFVGETASAYIDDLKRIEWAIIEIDTQRQDAERAHADLSKSLCESGPISTEQEREWNERLASAARDIDTLIETHNARNDELRGVQKALVGKLSAMV